MACGLVKLFMVKKWTFLSLQRYSAVYCGCYDFNNCTFITSFARPLPVTPTPTTSKFDSNAGASGITVIFQVLVFSGPSFQI